MSKVDDLIKTTKPRWYHWSKYVGWWNRRKLENKVIVKSNEHDTNMPYAKSHHFYLRECTLWLGKDVTNDWLKDVIRRMKEHKDSKN